MSGSRMDETAAPQSRAQEGGGDTQFRRFRFFDNREKYLLFVTTCSEKWVVADRVGDEIAHLEPTPPALRVFDAGAGDATVLTRVMRRLHHRFPAVPLLVVAKEVSLEDVRLSLEKMADRFFEHPHTVLVFTNMRYNEAPTFTPGNQKRPQVLNWREVSLAGTTAHEFEEQITALQPLIAEGWRTRTSAHTGNPVYVVPSVLVIYRADHRFMLDVVIPRPGEATRGYDLIIASQPFQARQNAEVKVRNVLKPLSRHLAPGGRMVVVQSTGKDPGMEIIRRIWPEEWPFRTPREVLIEALRAALGEEAREYRFHNYPDHRAEFRFALHTLPTELADSIGTSTLLAAWNAAVYVAQIEDERLTDVLASDEYLKATWDVLQAYGGLWFVDESFVIERRPGG